MPTETLPAHIRALRRKSAYPRPPREIKLIQTHISYVFLVDDEVYKLKKPVNLGFVDFTTLEKRLRDCRDEVRLNQRGCPGGVYLGVVPVTRDGESFRIDGKGEVVDYAVHMKRLPQDRMMDVLLEQDRVDFDMLGNVAARLADLHREAETGPAITSKGGLNTLKRNWQDSFDQLRPFIGRTLGKRRFERIESYVSDFLEREAALLRERDRDGWIRDCHGDLRSDAVCFDDAVPGGICIYDCIEFNEAFRLSDTGLDAAFLAMDLDYRGRPELSDLFVGLYAAAIGDKQLPLLLDFYKCYRAVVRGKVESLLLNDRGVSARQKAGARKRARVYFELAERYARRRKREGIVLVTGPSGSGKSVLAGVLASRLSAVLLSTDMLRRELFEAAGRGTAIDAGMYSQESRARVYDEIERQTRAFIAAKRPVVIDGTYVERSQRAPIVELSRASKSRLLLVECTAPDEVIKARQRRRESEAWTTSEGRYEVYLQQKQRLEPATELPETQRILIDTTTPLGTQIEAVEAKRRAV
ncbi:MAG TPA: AAA family ATPase [Dehalococcoidia bacterium]|nr:AAA family ATPase [Dehalococcoidia bacterium]